jgi:D-3-phosphoglycerate dehydrogenase
VSLGPLDELLRQADVLTVHTPLSDTTRGLIGARELALMPAGARVLNVGRGGIVDEVALAAAVGSGHLAGAAVDVFTKEPPDPDNPLLANPRILITPHLGASTLEAQISVATDVAEQIIDVLGGRPARWAVNSPQVASDEVAVVVPYQDLAQRMGSLWAQMGGGGVRRVEVVYQGEVARVQPAAITAEALGGMLRHFSRDRVTAVNAIEVAKRHGIVVREQRSLEVAEFPSSLLLRVDGDGPREIEGTVTLGQPRIIRLDGLRLDLEPVGSFLLLSHRDRPGLIGEVGQLLGDANVNIAEMQVGRDMPRGRALTAVRVDEPVLDPLADRLRQIAGVDSLHLVVF